MKYYAGAVIITIINIVIYPVMRHYAYLERGYHASGGEDILLVLGFLAAFMTALYGRESSGDSGQKSGQPESTPSTPAYLLKVINNIEAYLLVRYNNNAK